MNTPATTVLVLEPIELDDLQKATALQAVDHLTVDVINNTLQARQPNMQAPAVVARDVFKGAVGMLRTLSVLRDSPIDCTTTAGDDNARAARLLLKTFRTGIEKMKLAASKPYRDQTGAINDMADLLMDAVKPWESRFDTAIKAQEQVVSMRKALEQAEADDRARKVAQRIADVHAMADVPADMASGEIRARVQEVTITELTAEDFGHRHGEAIAAKDRAIAKLEAAAAKAEENEARERQIAEDRAAFEKQLADQKEELARMAARERGEKEAAAERALRQEQEALRTAAARQRITDMQDIPLWALSAVPAAIRAKMTELEAVQASDFDPLTVEAMEVHERVTKGMPYFLAQAEERVRTQAEKSLREARAAAIEDRVTLVSHISALFSSPSLEQIDMMMKTLASIDFSEDKFGDRVEHVRTIVAEQSKQLDAMRAERLQDDAAAAEQRRHREETAASEAKRSRRDAVMRMNAADMYALLAGVRQDPDYLHLAEELRARIDAKMADIAAAL